MEPCHGRQASSSNFGPLAPSEHGTRSAPKSQTTLKGWKLLPQEHPEKGPQARKQGPKQDPNQSPAGGGAHSGGDPSQASEKLF